MTSEHGPSAAGARTAPLVVAFCDSSYLPLLQLWLRGLQQLGIDRLRIFCLDAATQGWCESQGLGATALPWSGNLQHLWMQRIRVFADLLAAGQDFIHSDIDAIWVRNPLTHGSAPSCSEDLIFSQGTVWPPEVHEQWGFVLCCGWFWAKASAAARKFFELLAADVEHSGDDQLSVNRLLASTSMKWSDCGASDYQLEFNHRRVQCWIRPLHAVAGELSIALLPHREFQRLPEQDEHAVVRHYLTPKNCAQKLTALRAYGIL